GTVALVAGLVVVGALAIWVLKALIGIIAYVLVGALVVGGGMYLYRKTKKAVGPGTRARNRLDPAAPTYRQRNRWACVCGVARPPSRSATTPALIEIRGARLRALLTRLAHEQPVGPTPGIPVARAHDAVITQRDYMQCVWGHAQSGTGR